MLDFVAETPCASHRWENGFEILQGSDFQSSCILKEIIYSVLTQNENVLAG